MSDYAYIYPQPLTGNAPDEAAVRVDVQPATTEQVDDRRWDLLLACIAGYMLTAVGRIHQLFPVLDMLRPAFATGLAALYLYYKDRSSARRTTALEMTTKCLLAVLVWMVL